MQKRGITLIELLIAISLISIITIGLTSIDLFTRHHVVSSDKRAKLQNDVSFALDHISKSLMKAIGNIPIDHVNDSALTNDVIDTISPAETGDDINTALKIYIDGPRDAPDGKRDTEGDYTVVYRFRGAAAGSEAEKYRLEYCSNYVCCAGNTYEVIANHITAFTATVKDYQTGEPTSGTNVVDITISACWDPKQTHYACGTPDNPSVTMSESVSLPLVSTN